MERRAGPKDAAFLKAFLNPSEEDATVWARYTSASFDQGAHRQACNNAFDRNLEKTVYDAMKSSGSFEVAYDTFVAIIRPSFASVTDDEDMDAVLTRTHIILITAHGVYYRVAAVDKLRVNFIEWPENQPHDLLAAEQKPIFLAYKKDPTHHTLPERFHEDMIWSQALLRRLVNGEAVPKTITINNANLIQPSGPASVQIAPDLLGKQDMAVKVKQEKLRFLIRSSQRTCIDLDDSPPKQTTASSSSSSKRRIVELEDSPKQKSCPANPGFSGLDDAEADFEDVIFAEAEEQEQMDAAGPEMLMVGAAGVADLPGDLRTAVKRGDKSIAVAHSTP